MKAYVPVYFKLNIHAPYTPINILKKYRKQFGQLLKFYYVHVPDLRILPFSKKKVARKKEKNEDIYGSCMSSY